MTNLPNPYREKDGAPPASVTLPGGGTGRPLEGMRLFEGKADCVRWPSPASLHHRSGELSTRGHFIDVGTPRAFPLRTGDQETVFRGVGVPSLVGSWDVFPMLTTGLAGFREESGRAVVSDRVPLRVMIDRYSAPPHGNAAALQPQEKADLLAYLPRLEPLERGAEPGRAASRCGAEPRSRRHSPRMPTAALFINSPHSRCFAPPAFAGLPVARQRGEEIV